VARVTFAAVELLFGASGIQAAMAPLHRHPRPPLPKNTVATSESSRAECVRLCDAHMAYTYGVTIRMTFLSMTHHVHTYFVRIDP